MGIAIVDYGMGNLRSVAQALMRVSGKKPVWITSDASKLAQADRIVFPGQGAMPNCIHELEMRGLREPLLLAAQSKPFLGICVGMQMLFEHSEEGNVPCLGVFPGQVKRFESNKIIKQTDAKKANDEMRIKVPHMGWNRVKQPVGDAKNHHVLQHISDDAHFYFVHSYYVVPQDQKLIFGTTQHGVHFTSAIGRDNLFAVQFHPEKSAQAGLRLLENFVSWAP